MSRNRNYSTYYEVMVDKETSLDFVRLYKDGVDLISRKYTEKYGIKISPVEFEKKSPDDLALRIKPIIEEIQNNEFIGVVALSKRGNFLEHAYPFIFFRKGGDIFCIQFEEDFLETDFSKLFSKNFFVPQYQDMQKDFDSCTIFALNTIKNCLASKDFIALVESATTEELELLKRTIGQGSLYVREMSAEKAEKYVLEYNGKKLNFKAFYKAHNHALQINPMHLDMLSPESRKIYETIDLRRREFKIKKEEVSFEDDVVDLPDLSVSDPKKENFKKFLDENLVKK